MPQILIVDDEWLTRLEIEGMLTDLGYDVAGQAETGAEAIAMARELNPDLILMDVKMPGEMNGIDAAREIKAELGTPIVFISGYGDPEYIEAAKEIAPFGYVMKPFDEREVHAFIEIALSRRKLELELEKSHKHLEQTNLDLKNEIAARKKTERVLKESEKKYRTLVETNPYGFVEIDSTGIINYTNATFQQMTGYTQEELSEKSFRNLIEPASKQDELSEYLSILVKEQPQPTAYFQQLHTKGGRVIDIEVAWRYDRDNGGRIVGFSSIITDVTDRKQAEEALRESEQTLKAILDASPICIGLAKDRIIQWGNKVLYRMLGYEEGSLLGENVRVVYPDDETYEHAGRQLYSGLKDNGIGQLETQWVTKDDRVVDCDVYVSPIDPSDHSKGIIMAVVDLTEVKQVQEALQLERTRMKRILDAIPDGIYIVSQQHNIEYINPVIEQEFGSVDGRKCYQYFHDRTEVCPWCKNSEVFAGKSVQWEWYSSKNDRYYHLFDTPFMNVDGSISKFELFHDITEHKQVEEALRESEERMRSLIEQSPVSIQILDLNGMTIQVNKAWEELWGASWEEFVKFEYNILKDEQAIKLGIVSYLEKAYSGKTVSIPAREYDVQAISKIGNKRWVKSNVYPIKDASGNVLNVAILQEDITKRMKAEEAVQEAYRIINRSATVAFLWRNAEGWPVEFVSENVKKLLGYTAEEFTIGKISYATTVHPEDLERVAEEVKAFSGEEGKQDFRHEPYRIVSKDGEIKWLDDMTFIRRDEKGDITHYEGVVLDVSKRMKAENERESLQTQLQQAQKMEAVGTLAGGIAHDFNNLLMAIQGRTSIMLMKKDSSHPDIRHLKGIENNVESAAELTRQLLGFAKGGKYEARPTDLNELVKKENRMFGRTKKEITIHGKYAEDLWSVEVDRGQIEQVLLNLYINAWQAMPGGGNLYLETENVTLDEDYVKPFSIAPGRYVKISVADTGVGMDKATRERIFEPFFTTKEMGRGTGLGLASAYGIIKNHGGFINVYSEKGHGTTFNIYLPASEKEAIKEKKPAGSTLRGSETVLFVDDEDMIIEVAGELFEQLGYKVLTAGSGREAIETYEKNKEKIDIVLLDMIMPDMSGGETYDKLKEINPDIKVLLASGYSMIGTATEIMGRGCSGFIQKPFKMKELSQKLREILDDK